MVKSDSAASDGIAAYFAKYADERELTGLVVCRATNAVMRYRIGTMADLCEIYRRSPEGIKRIRNIGEKSAAFIFEACEHYLSENGESGDKTR